MEQFMRIKKITVHILSTLCILFLFVSQGHTTPQFISYQLEDVKGDALVCRPEGKAPYPAVIYNHGLVIDTQGYTVAKLRGYDIDGICQALADEGYYAFFPLRKSGPTYLTGNVREVEIAINYVKTLKEVNISKIALMGFSRGSLLTLMIGTKRNDIKTLLILAPAIGTDHYTETVEQVKNIKVPVLLMGATHDSTWITNDFKALSRELKIHRIEHISVEYEEGGHKLFWKVDDYWPDVKAFLNEHLKR